MMFSKITGTGSYLPQKILTNFDLEKKVDTSNAWIIERTGIVERRIADPDKGETGTMMGKIAAERAMAAAGVKPQDIDLIIVATCSPDLVFPATACLIQQALDIPPCPAFDIQAVCSGFVYGLSTVDQFIRAGNAKTALLIGTEVMSRIIDWKDRSTCILFGDAAGACVIQASEEPGILRTDLGADGRYGDLLYLKNNPVGCLSMQGNSIFKLAVNMLGNIANETLAKQNFKASDLDWLLPHQANSRIIQAMADKLGFSMDKVVTTVHKHGNTSAASIPLALDEYVREGRIVRGQHVLLEAFGGGLTWGTALIKY